MSETEKTLSISTQVPAQPAPPEAAATQAEKDKQEPAKYLPKTRGEKFYDIFQFTFGEVFVLALTAVLAFAADPKHGPEKIAGAPNVLKKFQGWLQNKLFHNSVFPLAEKGDFGKLIGGAIASTTILFHGGNLFAPFMKYFENRREKIANAYNKRFGTPEEVEIAHERLKDIPKQSWGDVIKGRLLAWGTVFTSMTGAYVLFGKDKELGKYRLDVYEEAFGRKYAGMVDKASKAIAETPIKQQLSEVQKANKHYRFGKVLALDIFATTAAILIWNSYSRFSAKKRTLKEQIIDDHDDPLQFKLPRLDDAPAVITEPEKPAAKHSEKHKPAAAKNGYADMVASQSAAAAEASPGLG